MDKIPFGTLRQRLSASSQVEIVLFEEGSKKADKAVVVRRVGVA